MLMQEVGHLGFRRRDRDGKPCCRAGGGAGRRAPGARLNRFGGRGDAPRPRSRSPSLSRCVRMRPRQQASRICASRSLGVPVEVPEHLASSLAKRHAGEMSEIDHRLDHPGLDRRGDNRCGINLRSQRRFGPCGGAPCRPPESSSGAVKARPCPVARPISGKD